MNIFIGNDMAEDKTLAFARKELIKYLTRMGYPDLTISLQVDDLTKEGMPTVADVSLDDQYIIDVVAPNGRIVGNNPRAVLLAVYRYLTLVGCRFLRPGAEFELIPVKNQLSDYSACEKHTASLRHRGACLEGADSIDNILDFIDWSPKIGFNSFFLQFEYPHIFLDRWYQHDANPTQKKTPWTMEDSVRLMPALNEALVERGMLQHRVGHGWTTKALGCTATGWDKDDKVFDEKTRAMIAEVNGKRELFYGIPTNTNLCLSNPDALNAFADAVVSYALKNESVDYIHIWLADAVNNSCSCEKCRSLRPSDHYIDLLNVIDEKLSEVNSKARLVILLYVDLLWAPKVNKLKHPERFVLMFAPITRTFEKSYEEHGPIPKEPSFELNHLKFPRDVESNLRFLQDWQKVAPVDSFVYDYYMGRAHYGDPTYINLSKLISKDLKFNPSLGLNGISSCQELRSNFPNGLATYVMGRTSLDLSLSFEELSTDYFLSCYGEDGLKVLDVLSRLSDCFSPDYAVNIGPKLNEDLANRLDRVPALLGELATLIATHAVVDSPVQAHMWDILNYFLSYTDILARVLSLSASGQSEEAQQLLEMEFKPFVWNLENEDQGGLDVYRVLEIIPRAIQPDSANRPT